MKDFILLIIVLAIAMGIMFKMLLIGLEKEEVSTCLSLQEQSENHTDFYILKTWKETCDKHNIIITAPIK